MCIDCSKKPEEDLLIFIDLTVEKNTVVYDKFEVCYNDVLIKANDAPTGENSAPTEPTAGKVTAAQKVSVSTGLTLLTFFEKEF